MWCRETRIEQEGSEAGIPFYTLCSMSKRLVLPIPVSVTCDAYRQLGEGAENTQVSLTGW